METKCIKLIGERNLIWENRELKLNDDEVLVKTVQSSICDADLRAFRGLKATPHRKRSEIVPNEIE